MTDHAILAPSSAARWVQCPGSVAMQLASPAINDDPEASEEGVAAHARAALQVRGLPVEHIDDREMDEAAALYANTIRSRIIAIAEPHEVHVEERVDCYNVHPENWGTPDCWVFCRATMVLDVYDFKYGHKYVDAFENWQLLNYAAGILKQLGIITAPTTINLHIIQPRSYHRDGPVRTWSLQLADFYPKYQQRLSKAAELAMSADAPCITGPECEYCTARHTCPALIAVGYQILEASCHSLPLNLSPHALGMVLTQVREGIARLEAIETGLTQQATNVLRNGGRVTGWMLVSTQGRKAWTKPIEEVIMLGTMMGVQLSKPGVITPTQAIAAGLDEALVDGYSARPSGKPTLTATGKRLACVFGKGM